MTVEGQSQWFVSSRDDLIVSVRLDLDGVAATRDPGDLVGRAATLGTAIYEDNVEMTIPLPAFKETPRRTLDVRIKAKPIADLINSNISLASILSESFS